MIDFDALTKRVAEVSYGGRRRREFFKNPKEVKETKVARLLPIPEQMFRENEASGVPFLIDRVYKNIVGYSAVAIPAEGEEDPVREAIDSLHEKMNLAKDEGDTVSYEALKGIVKKLYPKVRYMGFLAERGDDGKVKSGPLIWEPYETTFQEVWDSIRKIYSQEGIYVNDPEKGYDLEFTRIMDKGKVKVEFARRATSLGDKDVVQGLMESFPERDSLTRTLTTDELREAVESFVANGGEYVRDSTQTRGKPPASPKAAKSSDKDSNLSALDARMNLLG